MTDPRNYGERVKDCILQAVVDDVLGSGDYRDVYAVGADRVVKVEVRGRGFSNVHEWTIWQDVKETKWGKWFAPCYEIDAFGTALIQSRTMPLTDRQWRDFKEVPNFFADIRRPNFGMFEGRVVCHDYGNHKCFSRAFAQGRMVPRSPE